MRLFPRSLVNTGLAPTQGVIAQTERGTQPNDVVNIFLVNDVLNVVKVAPTNVYPSVMLEGEQFESNH